MVEIDTIKNTTTISESDNFYFVTMTHKFEKSELNLNTQEGLKKVFVDMSTSFVDFLKKNVENVK